ncbi:MAG TPA: cyclic nucleotide-binding domain-containing protein [Candidatus Limnocylindrales bacterium]|nr:cyclic nucleotide-binding domain-containing protein [Candidatus Limnocylindrales bacterium]
MTNQASSTSPVAGEPPAAPPQVAGSVLDRLSPAVRTRLRGLARMRSYEPGAEILRGHAATPFLAVIERGRVALRLRVPERGRVTIVTLEAGELVGWSAVVPPYRATVDAVALVPTRLVAYDAAALRELLAADCDLAAGLLPLVLESVSERLSASWDQLLDLFGTKPWEPW